MGQSDLFELLFKRKVTDRGSHDFLEQIINEHPYFSPAQFFLLKQTGKDSPVYEKLAAKTAILFDNPCWLNFQLTHSGRQASLSNTENGNHMPVPQNTDNDDDLALMEQEMPPLNLELKIPGLKKTETDETLVFEPMHLVDYFASQGIKLSEEALSSDKLGKQLKSFTEWLKTMKKLHLPGEIDPGKSRIPGPGIDQTGSPVDPKIQSLAEKSNAGEEVLTESMAEVLVKQGKAGKAIELYQKLSLLNPSKFAYFAAKIEQLKEI
jgi:hypothetical protein